MPVKPVGLVIGGAAFPPTHSTRNSKIGVSKIWGKRISRQQEDHLRHSTLKNRNRVNGIQPQTRQVAQSHKEIPRLAKITFYLVV